MRDIIHTVQKEIQLLEKEFAGNAPMNILLVHMQEKGISEQQVGIAIDELINKNIIKEVSEGYFRSSINGHSGDIMNKKVNVNNQKIVKCNKEQAEFRNLVNRYKSRLMGKIITHRGVEIEIAGAGNQAFRYKIAVAGLSDKEPVEHPVMYLDWDDTALQDDIVPAVHEILGMESVPQQAPITLGNFGGK